MQRLDAMLAQGQIEFNSKSPQRIHQLKTGVVIKEMADGVGAVSAQRLQPSFVATTREQEVQRRLPDNGPSPSPSKFTPNYALVHKKQREAHPTSETRFPGDIEYNMKLKK